MNNVYYTQQFKWMNAGWFLLYVLALVYLLFFEKKHQKMSRAFACSMIIIQLFLWNPLLANYMIPKYLNNAKEFARMGWGMLTFPVVGYLLTLFILGDMEPLARTTTRRMRLVLVLILCLLFTNQNRLLFKIPSNIYKLSDEVFEVVDLMDENGAPTDDYTRVGVLFPVGIGQGTNACEDVFFGIRHWDSKKIMLETNVDMLGGAEVDSYEFLLGDHNVSEADLVSLGYVKIGETESCEVYARNVAE